MRELLVLVIDHTPLWAGSFLFVPSDIISEVSKINANKEINAPELVWW